MEVTICLNSNAVMLAKTFVAIVITVFAGCEGDLVDSDKSLPAPLPHELPYEFHGKIFRVWGGDYFDIRDGQRLHYVCLQGIDSPKPGQTFYGKACNELRRIVGDQELRVVVTKLDDSKVAYVKAWLPDASKSDPAVDIGLEMIRRGFGWYDGNEFDGDSEYKSAQSFARAKKLGLWNQPDPVPPWNFNATE